MYVIWNMLESLPQKEDSPKKCYNVNFACYIQESNIVLVHVISTLTNAELWYAVSLILNKVPWKTGNFVYFAKYSW